MHERVVLLSRRMSNFHDPIITMHHSGIFAQKMMKQEEKSCYDVIMLIAFNELLNNRWIKLQISLKIDANFDGVSFRRKINNRTYFQIRMYRENRREDFANNDVPIVNTVSAKLFVQIFIKFVKV